MKCEKCGHITHKKLRSIHQNSYYWGVVVEILGNELGYPPYNMHDALRMQFLSKPDEKTGLMKIASTTDLSTKQMEDYIEEIRRWASIELSIYIPEPNEDE